MLEPITKLTPPGTFGQAFDMEPLRRADGVFPNAMVVGVRDRTGIFRPRQVTLPHQLYRERYEELRAAGAREVWVHPLFGTFAEVWTEVKLDA